MENEDYSIQELSDRTGLPRRTIHFYTQQGLLPPPLGAGLGAHYSRDHLIRLRLIPFLRKRGLRLDQIRERFALAEPGELERLHEQMDQPAEPGRPRPVLLNETARAEPSGQAYHHYVLSGGIILIVPANLSNDDQQKLRELLEAANRIYGPALDQRSSEPNPSSEPF